MRVDADRQRHLLLDGRQRLGGLDGWLSTPSLVTGLAATEQGLSLAPAPVTTAPATAGGLPGQQVVIAGDGSRLEIEGDWIYVTPREASACASESAARRHLQGIGGTGSAPTRLRAPQGMTLDGALLYVADTGNHRVQVFDLCRRTLRHVWGGPAAGAGCGDFSSPSSVAVSDIGDVFIADTGNHRLVKRCGRGGAVAAIDGTLLAAHFMFVCHGPRRGDRFVYLPARRRLECWTSADRAIVDPFAYATAAAARTRVLELLEAAGSTDVLLEWEDAYPAALRAAADAEPPFQSPVRLAWHEGVLFAYDADTNDVRLLDACGRVLGRVATAPGLAASAAGAPAAMGKTGSLLSTRLDSHIDQCVWHKITLKLAAPLPPGGAVTIWTYSSNRETVTTADVALLGEDAWRTGQSNADDFLVRSPPGRFLWLRVGLIGSGVASPVVSQLKVYFPREGYLQYLPAVYRQDAVSADFLDRFLALFQTGFEGIEGQVARLVQYFSPRGVPEPFLNWLGSWVGMVFDPGWPARNRRELLRRSPELYRRRGTAAGLKLFIKLALGLDVRIAEDWRFRKPVTLGGRTLLGSGFRLSGPCPTDRLRLDVNSTIGQFALDDVGHPAHDRFADRAHHFTVFVDGPLTESDTRRLRNLIEHERPAHASYTLQTVGGRMRVGVESTVGWDTGIGPVPRPALGRTSTLGYDTVLGHDPARPCRATDVGGGTVVGAIAVG